MHVVFRTDVSTTIGTGHLMRCLTLADALRNQGAKCEFICRQHPGHLIDLILSKGFFVHRLPISDTTSADLPHSSWLGTTQEHDAQLCVSFLVNSRPNWLIVDHYALDYRWENSVAPCCEKIMVIDDLADRAHQCDLLLDQTFGRYPKHYDALVPQNCILLCGLEYALLRPDFITLRPYSLQRRAKPSLKKLLISFGGIDKDNITSQVLLALQKSPLPQDCEITVVMGSTAPWLSEVTSNAIDMPWPTKVLVGVDKMAQLMADSDLIIGAAGSSSWERCCLGVPTIMLILASNQESIATELSKTGAVMIISVTNLVEELISIPVLRGDTSILSLMSHAARKICIRDGVTYTIKILIEKSNENHSFL
jgi:UDP-2,4-diacetamido-2,4,6-trideoxy-beta-L-altropyranose hydrolase